MADKDTCLSGESVDNYTFHSMREKEVCASSCRMIGLHGGRLCGEGSIGEGVTGEGRSSVNKQAQIENAHVTIPDAHPVLRQEEDSHA